MRGERAEDFTKVWEELERRRRRLTDLEKDYLIMRGLAQEVAGYLSGEDWGDEEGIQTAERELAFIRKRVVTTPEAKVTARPRKFPGPSPAPDLLQFSRTLSAAGR
jgi:hypothetical protein